MRDTGGGVPLRYTCRQMFLSAVSTGTLGISVADPELGFFDRSGPRNGGSGSVTVGYPMIYVQNQPI